MDIDQAGLVVQADGCFPSDAPFEVFNDAGFNASGHDENNKPKTPRGRKRVSRGLL